MAKKKGKAKRDEVQREAADPAALEALPDPVDEETEAVGGVLWTAFGWGAYPKTILLDVIERGRELSRGYVRNNVEKYGPGKFPIEYTSRCAETCGSLARTYSGSSATITVPAFEQAWYEVQGRQMAVVARFQRMRARAETRRKAPSETVLGGACS